MTPPKPLAVMTPAKVSALAKKIAACGDDRKAIVKLACKAAPDERARRRLYWQLVQQGEAGSAFAVQLVWILKRDDSPVGQLGLSREEVPAVAALLALLPDSDSDSFGTILGGWHEDLDRLVFEAWVLDPAAFLAREAEYAPPVRRGLAFVQGRAGHRVSAELRSQVLDGLAQRQATFLQVTLPIQRDDQTVELELQLEDPKPVRELALCFGTSEEWDAALLRALRSADWQNPAGLLPVLVKLPLRELGAILVPRLKTGDEWSQVHALLVDRNDPPDALVEAAAALDDRSTTSRALRTLYALLAAARFAQSKQAIPPELVSYLQGLELLDMRTTSESASYGYRTVPPSLAQTWVAGLKPLPRAEVLAFVRERLDDHTLGYEHLVVPLAAHFDRELLERLYLLDGVDELIEPGTVARIGLPLLAPLASLIDATPVDPSSRTAGRDGARQRAYAMAFEHALSRGEYPPQELDAHLVFDNVSMNDVKDGGPFDRLLRALPADRRDAIFRREIAADPEGVRPDRLRGVVQFLHLTEDATLVDEAIRRLLGAGYIVPGSIRALGERALEPLLRHLHLSPDMAEALSQLEPELTAEAFAKVQAAQGQKTKKPVEPPLPPYPGVSDRSLRALASKANHLQSYTLGKALEKATGDRETRHDLAWHLVEHRLLQPRPSQEVIRFLSDDVTEARAAWVARMLTRWTEPTEGDLFPCWTWGMDALVYRAFALRPELFANRDGLSPAMQRGVAFVARRRGEPVSAEVGEEIMLQLARSQATRGLTLNVDVPYLEQGEEVAGSLESLEDVRRLALLFGSAETWDRLFWQETSRNQWQDSRAVSSALAKAPLHKLVRLMTTRGWRRVDGDTMGEILGARNDDPEALLEAAQGLGKEDDEGEVRTALAKAALCSYEERGLTVPEALGELLEA